MHTTTMNNRVLLLNHGTYKPLGTLTWKRAMWLVMEGTVVMLADYSDRLIRSTKTSMPWPAVVMLKRHINVECPTIRFTRSNVLCRDRYTCAYCGVRPRTKESNPRTEELSLDHVVPKAQSSKDHWVTQPWSGRRVRLTSWNNVVCACTECNGRKGARTPSEAGMKLLFKPRRPLPWDIVMMGLTKYQIPDEWDAYVPSEWRGYWSVELTDED